VAATASYLSIRALPTSLYRPLESSWYAYTTIYFATDIIYLIFQFLTISLNCQASTLSEAGLAAETLSLINAALLLAGPHLNSLADFLSLSITHYQKVHRSTSLICSFLALLYVLIALFTKARFSLALSQYMFALIER
jgi:hypothetical protein